MGSFHCITDNCAKVVYREYEAARLEYQYPGEELQVIYGDGLTYTTQQVPNLGCAARYRAYLHIENAKYNYGRVDGSFNSRYRCTFYTVNQFVSPNDAGGNRIQSFYLWGPIYEWRFAAPRSPSTGSPYCSNDGWTTPALRNQPLTGNTAIQILCHGRAASPGFSDPARLTEPTWFTYFRGYSSDANIVYPETGFQQLSFQLAEGNCPPACEFKIFQSGNQIFSRVAPNCPTVNQFPCQLREESNTIVVNKTRLLQRVEVVDYSYEQFGLNAVRGDIPDNCLNIYRNGVTALIPPPLIGVPYLAGNYDFIAQICSAEGCPPPEFQVVCADCECRECPPGTCALECGDKICCYGDDGIAVASIPKEKYCQGEGGDDF
ncbi:hypothetical protein IQ238_29205 [Pleurocapsales cyanobacterium LEGE 06147]|nr:hypothetical protein [Pleurocapsales cyanobacterium LEGE 06147]